MKPLQLHEIEITDFRAFLGTHQFKLDRAPGLYYVTGRNLIEPDLGANGAGKSTIWDAVTWCLWGKTIRDKKPADAILPWYGEKPKTRVVMNWSRNGKEYELTRRRKPNSLSLRVDGTGGEVREIEQYEVEQIFGMSEDTYRRALVVGQFGQLFLDLLPEQQSAMFSQVLNLDGWVARSAAAKAMAGAHQADAQRFQASLGNSEARLDEAKRQRDTANAMADNWEEQHSTDLRERSGSVQDRRAALQNHVARAPAKPRDADVAQAAIATKADALAALRPELTRVLRGLADAKAAHASATRESASFQRDLNALEDELDKDAPKCRECGQVVSRKHIQDKAATMRAAVNQLINNTMDANAAITSGENAEKDMLAKIRAAEDAVDAARAAHTQKTQAYDQWERTRYQLDVDLRTSESALDALHDAANPYQRIYVAAKDAIVAAEATIRDIEADLLGAQEKAERFAYWVDAFKEIRLNLIDEALGELELTANAYAQRLGLVGWEIRFETEKEKKGGGVSLGFSVMLYPPEKNTPIKWECYSGGEVQRWHLAVTFGLSEILLARAGVSPNMEVLDEPTQHMSALGVEQLLEYLNERASEQGKAIYFVDHASLDKGAFKATITIEKDKHGSRIA